MKTAKQNRIIFLFILQLRFQLGDIKAYAAFKYDCTDGETCGQKYFYNIACLLKADAHECRRKCKFMLLRYYARSFKILQNS